MTSQHSVYEVQVTSDSHTNFASKIWDQYFVWNCDVFNQKLWRK